MDEKQTTAHAPGCVFCTIVGPQLEAMMEHFWPEGTREHFRNARVEVLKGMRGIFRLTPEQVENVLRAVTDVFMDAFRRIEHEILRQIAGDQFALPGNLGLDFRFPLRRMRPDSLLDQLAIERDRCFVQANLDHRQVRRGRL